MSFFWSTFFFVYIVSLLMQWSQLLFLLARSHFVRHCIQSRDVANSSPNAFTTLLLCYYIQNRGLLGNLRWLYFSSNHEEMKLNIYIYRISKIVLNSKWSTYCPFIIFVFGLFHNILSKKYISTTTRCWFSKFLCLGWLHNYLIPTTTTGTDNGPYILVFLRRDFHHKIFLLYILFYVLVPVNEKYHQMSPSVIE